MCQCDEDAALKLAIIDISEVPVLDCHQGDLVTGWIDVHSSRGSLVIPDFTHIQGVCAGCQSSRSLQS